MLLAQDIGRRVLAVPCTLSPEEEAKRLKLHKEVDRIVMKRTDNRLSLRQLENLGHAEHLARAALAADDAQLAKTESMRIILGMQ